MPVVTTLSENDVKEYMEVVLGDTASKLGWTVGGDDFDEPVNEILYILGESSYAFVTAQADVKKVRSIARVEAWRAAMYYTAHEISHSSGAPGTGQTSRADIHRHCKAMFTLAKSQFVESYPDDQPSRSVERWAVSYDGDYYANAEE